jgi:hypothetical protein
MTYPEYVALLKKKLDTGRYLLFLSGIINLILLEELVRRGMEAAS